MALSSSDLKNKMLSNINKLTDKVAAHSAIANAINSHVLAEATLKGAYVGVKFSDGTPDPNSGTYSWPCMSCSISGSAIASAASGNNHGTAISAWGNAIASQLILTVTFGGDPTSGVVKMAPAKLVTVLVNIIMSKENSQNSAIANVADAVINGLKSAVPQATSAGTSPIGAGPVTLIKVS